MKSKVNPMTHAYTATVAWERGTQDFLDRRYSRRHLLRFDGGLEIPASSSPKIVPAPLSDPGAVDPEEAFVAALASCHMLWFLDIAARDGWRVDRYVDSASGILARDPAGRLAMTQVTLRPMASFSGERLPEAARVAAMHLEAHEQCFIANSVRTEVRCQPHLA
jgi:organic hydroperoxide reductase OsmC/OhrA